MERAVGLWPVLPEVAIVRTGHGGEEAPARAGRHDCDGNRQQERAHIKLSSQGPREGIKPRYHRYPTPPATADNRTSQRATLPR